MKRQFILVWVQDGVIQGVWLYGRSGDAIAHRQKIADEEGYNHESDCIDVYEPDTTIAYWQYRDKEE